MDQAVKAEGRPWSPEPRYDPGESSRPPCTVHTYKDTGASSPSPLPATVRLHHLSTFDDMKFRSVLAALAAVSIHGTSARPSEQGQVDTNNLASRIETETQIALQGVLNNIGPDGSKAPGAYVGVVVASPSTQDPNCKYWHDVPGNWSAELMASRLLHMDARRITDPEDDCG